MIRSRVCVCGAAQFASSGKTSAKFNGFLGDRLPGLRDIQTSGAVSYVTAPVSAPRCAPRCELRSNGENDVAHVPNVTRD